MSQRDARTQLFCKSSCGKPRQSLNNNEVSGTNDMAGKAVRATVECAGKVPRYDTARVRERGEWSGGSSDIEGKTTRVGASECRQRTSLNRTRETGNRDKVRGGVASASGKPSKPAN